MKVALWIATVIESLTVVLAGVAMPVAVYKGEWSLYLAAAFLGAVVAWSLGTALSRDRWGNLRS